MPGYEHPYDHLVVGSTQRWRPGNARVSLVGGTHLVFGAQSPEFDAVKSWFAARSPTDLALGAVLGALACHFLKRR